MPTPRTKTTTGTLKGFSREFCLSNKPNQVKNDLNSLNELAIASNKMLSSKYFWITFALATASAGAYYFAKQPAGQRTMNKASEAAKNTYDSVTGFFAQLINCPKTNTVGTQTTPETKALNLTSEVINTLAPSSLTKESKAQDSATRENSPTNSRSSSAEGMIMVEHQENQPENSPEKPKGSSEQYDGFGLQRGFSSLGNGIANFFTARNSGTTVQHLEKQYDATSNTVAQPAAS